MYKPSLFNISEYVEGLSLIYKQSKQISQTCKAKEIVCVMYKPVFEMRSRCALN